MIGVTFEPEINNKSKILMMNKGPFIHRANTYEKINTAKKKALAKAIEEELHSHCTFKPRIQSL